MRISALGLLVVLLAGVLTPAAAAPKRGLRCTDGQFVSDTPLLPGGAAPAVIDVAGRFVTLEGCGRATARVKRRPDGWHVRARWRRCGDVRLVRLHGIVAPGACATMGGTVKARGPMTETSLAAERAVRLLVFSRTAGFRHPSIADAHRVLGALGPADRIVPTITEDPAIFTDEGLAAFDVVMFANTTGDVLDDAQQGALERFVRRGKGWVGVHSAADTEYTWPWYGRLVGAYFTRHPLLPVEVEVTTEDDTHPSTAHLPETFVFTDEIYNFDRNPRQDNAILLTVDEDGFIFPNFPPGPNMGEDHPIAWYKEFEGGRSFYTNLGHRPESWSDPRFVQHLLAGVRWAGRPVSWSRMILTDQAANPMSMAVAPDGRVFYVERTGELWVWSPATGRATLSAKLPVDTEAENGLLGVAVDPQFATNGWLYLYHSAPITDPPPPGPPGRNTLSRFTVLPDGTLDPASRRDILEVPSERQCCHEGGGLAFAPDGTLFLSVGDNTDPFPAAGYAPIDERPGRERENAQRTAQNPFDLRGKILRIRPDGSIPPGNLFPPDGSQGLPQIYTMGSRNPFRIAVDRATGRLFWGEVGPDAFVDSSRGPRGYDEINVAPSPGNYGWPYCIAENLAYADWDFATSSATGVFTCDGYRPAVMAYDYTTVRYLPLGNALPAEGAFFTGRTAIAGTFYRRPPGDAPWALPAPWADTLLMTDWTRDVIASADVGPDATLRSLRRLLPWEKFLRPIDVETGPDGALYVLEYGSGYFGDNTDARLSRIEYSDTGTLRPVAQIGASARYGAAPLTVTFSAEGSRAPGQGDEIARYEWDFDGDGRIDAREPVVQHTFRKNGDHAVSLVVVTDAGQRSFPVAAEVIVGNTAPVVEIVSPEDGITVRNGTRLQLQGSVVDAEDGVPACSTLTWDIRLGHNAHTHPIGVQLGCTATINATVPPNHGGATNLFLAVELSYTDGGGPGGEPPITGRDGIRINVLPSSPSGAFLE